MTVPEEIRSDVLVVGAGVVGLATARALLGSGLSVTVIEKNIPVAAASAANLGQISLADREESIELPWVYRTLELYRELQVDSGRDLAVRQSGGLSLLYTQREMDKAAVIVDLKRAAGLDCSLVHGVKVNDQEPWLDPSAIAGAVYSPEEGVLDPLAINYALLNSVMARGGRVCRNQNILTYETVPGQPVIAVSETVRYQADRLVVCTGAWSREVVAAFGLDIPLGKVRASAMVTQPIPMMIRGAVAPGCFLVREVDGGDIDVFGAVQEKRGGIVYAQANRTAVDYSTGVEADCLTGPTRLLLKHFPAVAPFQVLRGWSAVTSWTADEAPFFGYLPGNDSIFLMCGLKGAYSTVLAAAESAAASLSGRCGLAAFAKAYAPFAPDRFSRPATELSHV